MKNFKKALTVSASALMMFCFVAFTSCKKEDKEISAAAAAAEYCNCISSSETFEEMEACTDLSEKHSAGKSVAWLLDYTNAVIDCSMGE